jgi:hypothetical protein
MHSNILLFCCTSLLFQMHCFRSHPSSCQKGQNATYRLPVGICLPQILIFSHVQLTKSFSSNKRSSMPAFKCHLVSLPISGNFFPSLFNPPATGKFCHYFLPGWVRVDPENLKQYISSPNCRRGMIFFSLKSPSSLLFAL